MRILAIDPSLTATGAALVDTSDILAPEVWTITSKPPRVDTIHARLSRIDEIVYRLTCLDDIGLVVVEAPAYDSRRGKQHDRSGLWWAVVTGYANRATPVVEVTTGGIKRYATGKGNASKDAVLLAVARRFAHVDVTDNNQADALVLAAMAADHYGSPLADMPKTHRVALDAVHWPKEIA